MDPKWISRYKYAEDRIILKICEIMPECVEALAEDYAADGGALPNENTITRTIVGFIKHDIAIREQFLCISQYETEKTNDKGAYSIKGLVDIAIFWKNNNLQDEYIAFEVKRLNVKGKSLVSEYVLEGILRFIEDKYSENLPLGGMIGIAMNGNLNGLKGKIVKKLKDNRTVVKMVNGPTDLVAIGNAERFETIHERAVSTSSITIRHTLFPFF